jgi:GT2 family glycosyltransferase
VVSSADEIADRRIYKGTQADIVVCVHNALEDVMRCLASVVKNTYSRYKLILVDDGSNADTRTYLDRFAESLPGCKLIRNENAQGYTRAANQGLQASSNDYIVLLNSDTIVTPNWLEKIIECGEDDPRVGVVGPLSNAASWQSIPDLFDEDGDWAINKLPENYSPLDMSLLVQQISEKRFPKIPFINGFCYAIKRQVIETIGFLDEDTFPRGYGEENDYSIRARKAGFLLAIADHTYVYHSKSRSYSHERRKKLSKEGQRQLRAKYGDEEINRGIISIQNSDELETIRSSIKTALEIHDDFFKIFNKGLSVLFLLPVRGGGGGTHSVVQEANGMRMLGIEAKVAISLQYRVDFKNNYQELKNFDDLFITYGNKSDLFEISKDFDLVIGTVYHSIKLLEELKAVLPYLHTAYYIQDYEPRFFKKNSGKWKEAYQSYSLLPDAILFAKTQWLCDLVEHEHNVHVYKVCPSLDREVFFPSKNESRLNSAIVISAMIRPSTPRRGPSRTMRVLREIYKKYRESIEIHIFGCSDKELSESKLVQDFEFINHGVLQRQSVADVLRASGIFVDFSDYQAFGRTGLEALACGAALLITGNGGVTEYAEDGKNAILVDVMDEEFCIAQLSKLVEDSKLRGDLQAEGIQTASNYSIKVAALSEIEVFKNYLVKHRAASIPHSMVQQTRNKQAINVLGILQRRSASDYSGSAYIRVILPLSHPTIQQDLSFRPIRIRDLNTEDPEILVIQRTAIENLDLARRIIKYASANGISIVFEIDDDLINIPDEHPEYRHYIDQIDAAKLLASNADLITVPSEVLGDRLREYNPRVEILPNCLDESLWDIPDKYHVIKKSSNQVKILYMGTLSHERDLEKIREPILQLKSDLKDEFEFELVGGFGRKFLANNWYTRIHIPSSAIDYLCFVDWFRRQRGRWHIGLAPLEHTEFNESKSYIKYLDYSAMGLAGIYANNTPYNSVVTDGKNALLVDQNEDSWYQAIQHLIENSSIRSNIASNALSDLHLNHTLKSKAYKWADCYLRILGN